MVSSSNLALVASTNERQISLYDLFDFYLETITNRNSYYTTKNLLTTYKRYFYNRNARDLDTVEIQKFVNYHKRRDISELTLYNYFKVLKSVFNFAIHNNFIDKNPCDNVKIKHVYKKDRIIIYSRKYLKQLLKLYKHTYIYYCVLIALHTRHETF